MGVIAAFRMAARRWYLLFPLVLVSVGVAWLAYTQMPATYGASVLHQVNAPSAADAKAASRLAANPFANAKATAAELVASAQPQGPAGESRPYTIEVRPDTPLITVRASADSQRQAFAAVESGTARLTERLAARQAERQVPAEARMMLATPVAPAALPPVRTVGIRVFAVTLVFGLMLSVVLAAAVERSARRRRALIAGSDVEDAPDEDPSDELASDDVDSDHGGAEDGERPQAQGPEDNDEPTVLQPSVREPAVREPAVRTVERPAEPTEAELGKASHRRSPEARAIGVRRPGEHDRPQPRDVRRGPSPRGPATPAAVMPPGAVPGPPRTAAEVPPGPPRRPPVAARPEAPARPPEPPPGRPEPPTRRPEFPTRRPEFPARRPEPAAPRVGPVGGAPVAPRRSDPTDRSGRPARPVRARAMPPPAGAPGGVRPAPTPPPVAPPRPAAAGSGRPDPATFDSADLWAPVTPLPEDTDGWLPAVEAPAVVRSASPTDRPRRRQPTAPRQPADEAQRGDWADGWPDFDHPEQSGHAGRRHSTGAAARY